MALMYKQMGANCPCSYEAMTVINRVKNSDP